MEQHADTAVAAPDREAPPTHPTPRRRGLGLLARLHEWRDGDPADALLAMAALGVVAEVFLLFLRARFPLTRWFPAAGVSLGFPQQMSGDWATDARWIMIVLAGPFLGFVPALFVVRQVRGRLGLAIVAGFGLIFGITLLGLYPITAADVFHYLADARTLWVYHQNPMQVPPQAHPFWIGISWAQQPSPYGPLWQLIACLPVALAGDHAVASLIGFKLLGFVSVLACSAFVYLAARRFWPGREAFALLAFLWNPFVLFRAIGNGHNDLTMMAFALAGLYCVALRRWRWALPLLALSACIKYSTVIIIPPVLIYGWATSDARRRREIAIGTGYAVLAAVAVFAPFWRGFDTFKTFVQNANMHITAMPEWFAVALQPGFSQAQAERIAKAGGYALFALSYLALLFAVWRRRTFPALVAACALAMIAYLTFSTWWFRPWYFLWFMAPVALLPSAWWTVVVACTAFGTTFFDIIEQYRYHWPWMSSTPFRAYGAPVVCAFIPLLVALAVAMIATSDWALRPREVRADTAH
jgi:hypothetical protein